MVRDYEAACGNEKNIRSLPGCPVLVSFFHLRFIGYFPSHAGKAMPSDYSLFQGTLIYHPNGQVWEK